MIACVATSACGSDPVHHLPDGPGNVVQTMVVEPADQSVTITNHMTLPELYHAFLVDPDGTRHDVTGTATFTIDPLYGQFYGPTALITGKGAGPTRVTATQDGVTGDTGLTIFVKTQIDDPEAPTAIQDMFASATEDSTSHRRSCTRPTRSSCRPTSGSSTCTGATTR